MSGLGSGPWAIPQSGGEDRPLGAALESELGEQVRDLVLHRRVRRDHGLADRAVGHPFSNQFGVVSLLGAEAGEALLVGSLRAQASLLLVDQQAANATRGGDEGRILFSE